MLRSKTMDSAVHKLITVFGDSRAGVGEAMPDGAAGMGSHTSHVCLSDSLRREPNGPTVPLAATLNCRHRA